MISFEHERTICFIFVYNKDVKLRLKSKKIDREVRLLLKRNGLWKKINGTHYRLFLRSILEFLGKNKLDQSIREEYSDTEYKVTITVGKRGRFTHSG